MAYQAYIDLLKHDVKDWNAWRSLYRDVSPDFSGADLSNAKLSSANLSRINFSDANLTHADLDSANLSRANLSGADLSGANLSGADLSRANLSGADLSRARFWQTVFMWVDLSSVKGLDTTVHSGPSSIDITSVVLPRNAAIYRFFLRGIGFPGMLIDYLPSLLATPIQYHSLFISYCSSDQTFATQLYTDLQDRGVRCWFAPEDMKIGDKIRARIDGAIYLQEKLLLLLSEDALASTWVEDEVEIALEKEQRQQREVLFPIRLDESVMKTTQAWASKLRRTRHIGDFTHWTDPQVYQRAFERLLRDLRTKP